MDPRTWFQDFTPFFLYLLFIVTIGPLLFGYHLAELNAPSKVLTCGKASLTGLKDSGLPQCIPMNPTQLGLVQSIFTLGGLIGALSISGISAGQGRRRAMQYSTISFIAGPIFESLAPNIAVLTIGRFISGLGAGASVVVVPIYVSEISPPAERGFFGAFTQVMVNVGIFLTQLLGYFFSYGQMWRLILGIGGAIGVGLALGLFTVVESPKLLATTGRTKQARDILQKIRGKQFNTEEEFASWGVETSVQDAEGEEERLLNDTPHSPVASLNQKNKNAVGLLQVMQDPHYRKAVFVVMLVMVAQQLTGINSIIMYGVALLARLLQSNSALLNLFVSAMNILVTIACAPLVDKLGRKTCLIGSISGMGISSLLLAFAIQKSIPILSAVAVLLFVASFAFGLGPVPFILASELVGPEAVNATQSWALGTNWISTFLVAQFFPMINAWLGGGIVYLGFAVIAAVFATAVAVFVPETKGKRDADEVWGRISERHD